MPLSSLLLSSLFLAPLSFMRASPGVPSIYPKRAAMAMTQYRRRTVSSASNLPDEISVIISLHTNHPSIPARTPHLRLVSLAFVVALTSSNEPRTSQAFTAFTPTTGSFSPQYTQTTRLCESFYGTGGSTVNSDSRVHPSGSQNNWSSFPQDGRGRYNGMPEV